MSGIRNSLFGNLVLATGLVSEEQIEECLEIQQQLKTKGGRTPRLGEIMAQKQYLTVEQVKALLRKQRDVSSAGGAATKSASVQIEDDGTAKDDGGVGVGKTFGKYEVLHRLGQDAKGISYKAKHIETGELVCLRILVGENAADPDFLRRFEEQAKRAAKLKHPNILRILAAGAAHGHLYYAADYADGVSFRRLLDSRGRIDPALALKIAEGVCEALECGHAHGVFHQELTPSNIIILADRTIKVAGFGALPDPIRNLKQLVETVGETPFYVAPEQAAGGNSGSADARTDIYSLGAILYHALSGQPPFAGDSVEEVLLRVAEEDLIPLSLVATDIPEEAGKLVQTMLAPDPDDRFQTAARALDAIRNLQAELSYSGDTADLVENAGVFENGRSSGTGNRPRATGEQPLTSPGPRPAADRSSGMGQKAPAGRAPQRGGGRPKFSRARQHAKGGGSMVVYLIVLIVGIAFIGAFVFYITKHQSELDQKQGEIEREKERERQNFLQQQMEKSISTGAEKEPAESSAPKKKKPGKTAPPTTAPAPPVEEADPAPEANPEAAATPAAESKPASKPAMDPRMEIGDLNKDPDTTSVEIPAAPAETKTAE